MSSDAVDLAELVVDERGDRWVELYSRPWAVDRLAARAAELLEPHRPDAIGCWNEPDSVVLAYALGVALRIPVIPVEETLGLVERAHAGDRPDAPRIAIVAPQWSSHVPLQLLAAFFGNEGHEVPVALSLLASSAGESDVVRLSLEDA